jgi:hypothetical protein
MRYVLVFAAIGFFLAWDIVYNQGQYIDRGIGALTHAVRYITG